MKAITLHQPRATLVALGVKTIETRSWAPPKALIGERLLIHAGREKRHLQEAGAAMWRCSRAGVRNFDLGAIVASCVLADAVPMVDASGCRDGTAHLCIVNESMLLHSRLDEPWPDGTTEHIVSGEMPYGDFAPGRWAWLLEDVKPTTERCPACWGEPRMQGAGGSSALVNGEWIPPRATQSCRVCLAQGACPPIPAKGHQRIWDWKV